MTVLGLNSCDESKVSFAFMSSCALGFSVPSCCGNYRENIYIYIYCYLFYYFLELWSFFFFHIFHLEVGLLILLYSSVFFFVVSIILDIIFSFPTLFHKWLMILLTSVSFSLFYYVSEDKLNPWTKDHKWNNKQSSCYSRWTWRSVVVCFTVRRRAW